MLSIFQDELPNLKCFSLTCYHCNQGYDTVIVPTLRRMLHLQELTLYIHIFDGPTFIGGTDLDEQILVHMPQLHTFTFYIACQTANADPTFHVTNDHIEQSFANGKYRQVNVMVDYLMPRSLTSRVFSLPCKFSRLDDIGNNIPNIVFNTVTHVTLLDKDAFVYDFFVRLARAFPFLQKLSVSNIRPPFWDWQNEDENWCSAIEYPHLIFLNIGHVHPYYVEHFLNERKMYLPRLTELEVEYETLQEVTHNFTRLETQRNCGRVKQLCLNRIIVQSENFHRYFPSLLLCSFSYFM